MQLLDRVLSNPRRWSNANLIAQIGIIVTGGAVRLTGSGLGCSTWPLCEPGSFTPEFHRELTYHPFVEYGNRTLTGVLTVIALGLALAAGRTAGRSSGFKLLAWLPFVGVITQGLVGGATVLLHLHPAVVSLHMLLSLALVAVSMLIVVRVQEGDGPFRWRLPTPIVRLALALASLSVVVVVLGVLTTGTGPHSGDKSVGYRYAFDPLLIVKAHSYSVIIFLVLLVIYSVILHRSCSDSAAITARNMLLAITVLQAGVGYTQYFTHLPVGLVGLHLLLAALWTAATTNLVLSLRERI